MAKDEKLRFCMSLFGFITFLSFALPVLSESSKNSWTSCTDGYGLNYTLPMLERCKMKPDHNGNMVQTIPKVMPFPSVVAGCYRRKSQGDIPAGHRICRIPDCGKNLCKNGWCEETFTGFKCHCYTGFQGEHCDEVSTETTTQQATTKSTTGPTTTIPMQETATSQNPTPSESTESATTKATTKPKASPTTTKSEQLETTTSRDATTSDSLESATTATTTASTPTASTPTASTTTASTTTASTTTASTTTASTPTASTPTASTTTASTTTASTTTASTTTASTPTASTTTASTTTASTTTASTPTASTPTASTTTASTPTASTTTASTTTASTTTASTTNRTTSSATRKSEHPETTTPQDTTTPGPTESQTTEATSKPTTSPITTKLEQPETTTSQDTTTPETLFGQTTEATSKPTTSPTTTKLEPETTTSQDTTTPACTSPLEVFNQNGWLIFGESSYYLGTSEMNHACALSSCSEHDSHLVYIETEEEQDFIENQMAVGSRVDYWIGLTGRSRADARWLDGSSLTYDNTAQDSFDERVECFRIKPQWSSWGFGRWWYTWQDRECSREFRYICEKEIDDNA